MSDSHRSNEEDVQGSKFKAPKHKSAAGSYYSSQDSIEEEMSSGSKKGSKGSGSKDESLNPLEEMMKMRGGPGRNPTQQLLMQYGAPPGVGMGMEGRGGVGGIGRLADMAKNGRTDVEGELARAKMMKKRKEFEIAAEKKKIERFELMQANKALSAKDKQKLLEDAHQKKQQLLQQLYENEQELNDAIEVNGGRRPKPRDYYHITNDRHYERTRR
ncbi:uncharacterized protein LY89DRAFT_748087 [Mollisia scopiformis]|uniref:Uncharacterized protein n=1 Tax=Mollisia scopiformis TaxID=149040 RepID=A0A194X9T6_MOLSC|nr:uncharacterized protein LY89DRAFT_748087 [Mollisia scopiformis]KUJ16921.1 hypothetical protein LY89DRAFT_748087 [Mollisia scopiformis]